MPYYRKHLRPLELRSPRNISCRSVSQQLSKLLVQRLAFRIIQPIEDVHIFLTNLKVVDVCISSNALYLFTLRQRNPPFLQAITNKDLSGQLAILLSQLVDDGVVRFLVARDGAISFYYDALFLAVGDDVTLLVPRMKLYRSPISRMTMTVGT